MEVLNMSEGKGKVEDKKPRGGRRKNAFNNGGKYVSDEIRKWAREQSGSDRKTNNNNNPGGYNHPGY
jgi:hypothetical protein